MKKRIFGILMGFIMVVGLLCGAAMTASAEVDSTTYVAEVNGIGYETIQAAITASQASENSTLKLLDDIMGEVSIGSGTFTVDLNGHSIINNDSNALWIEGGNIIVTDSSADKTGIISGETTGVYIFNHDTVVSITGGTIFGGYESIYVEGATCIIGGDTVTCDPSSSVQASVLLYGGADCTIRGGTHYGTLDVLEDCMLTVNCGSFRTNPSDYLANGYSVYQNSEQMWTVAKSVNVGVRAVERANNNKLTGAHLQLIDSQGTVLNEWYSTNDIFLIEQLSPQESYTLRCVVAPDGFTLPEDVIFSIDPDGTITSSGVIDGEGAVLIELARTEIFISAVDNYGYELEGALLQIHDSNGAIVDVWFSTDGVHRVDILKTQVEYTLVCTKAPDGYVRPSAHAFVIDEEGTATYTGSVGEDGTLLVEFSETEVYFSAVDRNGRALEGATLQIIDKDGCVQEEWISEKRGKMVSHLCTGMEYILRCIVAPDGYICPEERFFFIDEDGTVTYTGSVDEDGTLLVELSQTEAYFSAVDRNGSALVGATLQIIDKDGWVREEWISIDTAEKVSRLPTGMEYILRCVVAPDGFTVPEDVIFSIGDDGKISSTGVIDGEGILRIEFAHTEFFISAVDDMGVELEGATLQILDSNGVVVDEWRSTDSFHRVEGLTTLNEYTLVCTVAPNGYVCPSEYAFVLDEEGKVTYTGSVEEDGTLLVEFSRTEAYFSAVDRNGSALIGAALQIIDKDGCVFAEWISLDTAEMVSHLHTGEEHILRCVAAPDGFTVPEDVTFILDAQGKILVNGAYVDIVEISIAKAAASVTLDGVTEEYSTIGAALEAAEASTSGDTVLKLLDDVRVSLDIMSGTFTLDLNGYTIFGAQEQNDFSYCVKIFGGNVTIIDSSYAKTGTIGGNPYGLSLAGGNCTIRGGYIDATNTAVLVENSNCEITDETIIGGEFGVTISYNGNCTITGGTINSNYCGVFSYDGSCTITEGTIYGQANGLNVAGGVFYINGGVIESDMQGILLDGGEVTVTGGTIKGSETSLSYLCGMLSIKGGSFSHEPEKMSITFGYAAILNSDTGLYDVTLTEFLPGYYPVWVGNEQVREEKLSGDGWSYDPETKTLTLENFNYHGEGVFGGAAMDGYGSMYAVYSAEDLHVVLVGDNTITITASEPDEADGIGTAGDLTISGTGKIEITAGDDGLYAENITIDSGIISINALDDDGIDAEGDLTINGGTVNIVADDEGIEVGGDALINNGTIIVKSGTDAIDVSGNITINGGSFDLSADSSALEAGLYDELATLTINDGSIRIAESPNGYSAVLVYGEIVLGEDITLSEGSKVGTWKNEVGDGTFETFTTILDASDNLVLTLTIEKSYLPGDINGDESVDINDALQLFLHSMLPETYPLEYEGKIDFTNDGLVDICDALYLFMYSMMPDLYPLA